MEQLCDQEQLDIGRRGVRIPRGTTGGRLSSLYLDHGDGYINLWLCDKLHVTTCEHTAREEACMGHDPNVSFLVLVLYECYLKYKVLLEKTELRLFRSSLRICQSKPEIISKLIIKAKHQIQVIGSSIFYLYILWFVCFWCFQTSSHCVAQAGLLRFLPLPLEYWNHGLGARETKSHQAWEENNPPKGSTDSVVH